MALSFLPQSRGHPDAVDIILDLLLSLTSLTELKAKNLLTEVGTIHYCDAF